MTAISRRGLLIGGLGLAGGGVLAACSGMGQGMGSGMGSGMGTRVEPATGSMPSRSIGPAEPLTAAPGQRVVTASLVAKPTTLDLGGPTVATWAYGDTAPGPLIRATAGDLVRVTLDNRLPADTTIHWHGVALRNAADGVPGMTQDPIHPGERYTYEFVVPDPGTYFYHPHVGLQLDRGLYAALVVDDPGESGDYDVEHVIVLDDWLDGTGTTPEAALAALVARGGSGDANGQGMGMGGSGMGGMGANGMGGMGANGMGGDVSYPHFLVNGRVPAAPTVLRAKPRQRVRLRIINAGSDTIFTVAVGGHSMTVTHADGFPVVPTDTSALHVGMGERFDVLVTVGDGVFPLVALPYGKPGQALALIRTGAAAAPSASVRPDELSGAALLGSALSPAEGSRLPSRPAEATSPLTLNGQMSPYAWGINGAPYGQNEPIMVEPGQRLRLDVVNQTMMIHPLHIHGHTFGLVGSGLRKDTVLVGPMESLPIELQADNPGSWMTHCHNVYHGESGMMIALEY